MIVSNCEVVTDRQGRELRPHGTALFPVEGCNDDLVVSPVLWHWHDDLEAAVVRRGAALLSVEGESHAIRQGDGFFINAGVLHGVFPREGECLLHSVVFHPRLVGGGVDSIFHQQYVQPLVLDTGSHCVLLSQDSPGDQELLSAVREAWDACAGEEQGYEFTVRAAMSRLVLQLFRRSAGRPRQGPSEKALRDAERVKAMLRYIEENLGETLSVAGIARSAAVSESECLRCFRSVIGVTPIQYVKHLRVERAAALLAGTEERVADIAGRCGFGEMSYFARTFRELKGCTPSEYRRQRRSGYTRATIGD